ncbi:hypothetical protein K2173_008931 [Erythroxylum novogranatense]|uniref:Beta-galactosidase n=1 Tax=Erythroxylum novogranatense TaxID=1862640 RepID=A0AAV8TUV5_9ROSI|nr:hypothetical protein K2173_008931 [Erythroxylum novogranatense]
MVIIRVLLLVLQLAVLGGGVHGGNVTYDGRSLIINGQRKILFSGSIHYPRSTPEMWPSLIAKAKEGGLDVIDTYVFWNLHEPRPRKYDFRGRLDIIRFIKQVQAHGLYVCLRIGPFIEAEWSYGGLPAWLHDVPGIVYRSNNNRFKVRMRRFVTKMVKMMQSHNLFASQGGPIILSQIENEYGTIEKHFGEQGPAYVKWAARLAVGFKTGVPWTMCKQNDAPDPVINSCNGRRCGVTFVGPNSPNKPAIWTENWTTRYQVFGEDQPERSAEDIAFHVALFIAAKRGSFVNYYMYHGGTNFGRTASAFVTTSYYDQAPIDEYGLIRQPKWGHLKELHTAIKKCQVSLLSGAEGVVWLGHEQQAYVFNKRSNRCAAFLVNNLERNAATVFFRNASYVLPPKSISILPDCKNVIFNTAKVSTQSNKRKMIRGKVFDAANMWIEFQEAIPNFDGTSIKSHTLLEQMRTTKDASDYLWYTFRFRHESSDKQAMLRIRSLGHVLLAFVNGKLVGSARGSFRSRVLDLGSSISLRNGINNVSLLSAMVGLPASGAFLERRFVGIRDLKIQGIQDTELSRKHSWGYQVGLAGERLQIYREGRSHQVRWRKFSYTRTPLTWYKTVFDAPVTDAPIALNLGSMGKGEAWVNGQSIGRYWPSFRTPSGSSSQTWYHVPKSFLKPRGNLLVLLEEEGGNPLQVSVDTASISQVCGHVSTSHPPPVSSWAYHKQSTMSRYLNNNGRTRPQVQLSCPSNSKISQIEFASYGTPLGGCGTSYNLGTCHSNNSKSVVEKECLGKMDCSIAVDSRQFGGDPCPANPKSLLAVADCK